MLTSFLTSSAISAVPAYVFGLILAAAAAVYFFGDVGKRRMHFLRLIWSVIGFRVLYALFVTIGQYYVWSQDEFTRLFLREAGGGLLGYFLPYSWLRFWLGNVVLVLVMAGLFWLLLDYLKRRTDRYFEEGEPELGVLVMLLVGWPESLVFLAMLAFTVVFVSVLRAVVWRSPYTTLGAPFLIAAALTYLRGERILEILNWGVFRI